MNQWTGISAKAENELHNAVMQRLFKEKAYLQQGYSMQQMAAELNTNTRYLRLVFQRRLLKSFNSIINELRIKDAQALLRYQRNKDTNMEKIAVHVGYNNRQTFYAAFRKLTGLTPNEYRDHFSRANASEQ